MDVAPATTGTAGNDNYVATIGTNGLTANGTTLNAGDVLNGGAGTDTLSVSISGTNTAGVTTSAVTLSNIENISVVNFQTDDNEDNTIDLAQATGVTAINVTASASTGDTLFTNVRGLVAAEMGNGAGDLSISYTDSVVSGTSDAQTLILKGQTGGAFTVAGAAGGVETLNIVSQTAANTIAIKDAANATIKTMNISGDQKLTLTEGATNPNDAVTTINAANMTGQLLVTTGSAAANMNITGGSANDTITLGNFTADDTVNGGDGTDTLVVDTTGDMTATTLAKVSNVETLKMTGAGAALTMAANVAGLTKVDLTNTDNQTVTLDSGFTNALTVSLENGDKVDNSRANAALTVTMSGADLVTATTITGGTGTDTINLKADGTASISTNFDHVTFVDNITIVDNGDGASGAVDASGVNIEAGKDVNLNLGAYATALTIDASALDAANVDNNADGKINDSDASAEKLTVSGASATAALTITGGGAGDDITGGTVNDVIDGGAGNDSITGTAGGNDSIMGGAGDDTINMGSALTSADTIDGGEGNDTLVVTALNNSALTNVTNVENLAFNGTATLTSNLSFTAIDLSNGTFADSLTFGTGFTNAVTVTVDAGDKVVNSANVAMTVKASAADLESGDITTTITGGTGTDTLQVTATGATVATSGLITDCATSFL